MTAAEALGCQACGLPITPCLICSRPIPISGAYDTLLKSCRKCGVVNPLGDRYREVLDIPPISALPSAMVRRAQIARIGRRPYVLAKHAHFMHLSSVSKAKGGDENGGSESYVIPMREISARLSSKGSPVPEVFVSAEEGLPLTFLPYMQDVKGAKVHQEAVCAGRKAVEAKRFYPFLDSESPVKRMRLSRTEEVIDHVEKHSNAGVYSSPHQARVASSNGGSAPAASNGALMNDSTKLGESLEKLVAGSGTNTEVFVLSTPVNTNCARPTTAETDDEEIRSSPEAGETSIPVEASRNVEHEAVVANHHSSSAIELQKSAIHGLVEEASKSTSLKKVTMNVEDARPTAGIANAIGSGVHRQANLEDAQMTFETPIKVPSTNALNGDADCDLNASERDIPVKDVTGTEELSAHLHGRVCSECGEASEGSGRPSRNVDEAEFMRCCTQILELYCPHTLKADMRTPNSYPLCCPLPRYPLPAGSTSSSKVCRSYVTQFTVDTLRAAHATLISTTQESTSEEVASPFRGVEQALSMAEQFLKSKSRMNQVQGLIQEVKAASAQASRDFKAYGDRGAFALATRLIPRLLTGEKQQKEEKAKNDVQLMATFLQDINKLLTNCFQYVGKVVEASLLPVDDNHAASNALFALDLDNKPGLEAVRIAVPVWLRMYHDVAHSSGLLK